MSEREQRDFDSPYAEPGEVRKPSQAEGERDQPGEEKDGEKENFDEPGKPSQAEGERKPYT